jgi:hypothetical protein
VVSDTLKERGPAGRARIESRSTDDKPELKPSTRMQVKAVEQPLGVASRTIDPVREENFFDKAILNASGLGPGVVATKLPQSMLRATSEL